jgi:hypothetical protein
MSETEILEEMRLSMRENGQRYINGDITWRVFRQKDASITRHALKRIKKIQTNVNKSSPCLTCSNVADNCTPEDEGSPCGDKPEYNIDLSTIKPKSEK